MLTLLYRIYQIFIALPLVIVVSILTALVTIVGSLVGDGRFWGYYPGHIWSRFMCRVFLLPIKVEGRENLRSGQSYVFVSNHQSIFDVFLLYGYLDVPFRWMMKQELRKIPLVGLACQKGGHVFIDRVSPGRMRHSIVQARDVLHSGTSLVVFPEGSRSYTGQVGNFHKGAFALADELGLPIVPITLNGPFRVLPRRPALNFVRRHRMTLTIHPVIPTLNQGGVTLPEQMERARTAIIDGLDKE